jgi:hypothetical protein
MGKGAAGVVRRVYENALDPSGEFLLQRLQRKQVISENQNVFSIPVAIGFVRVFYQNSRLQLRLNILADPG